MSHGVGIHPVSLEDPIVATYLIHTYYNRSRGGMLEEKKFVRKNLQSQVTRTRSNSMDPWTCPLPIDAVCIYIWCTGRSIYLRAKQSLYVYICYGCCAWSCSTSRSITRCISDRMCWISSYTTARWSGVTYSNWCSNSHMLMYSICNCSFSSNTANVFSWKAVATVVSIMYMTNTLRSILYLND